jgi:hypothetical protein
VKRAGKLMAAKTKICRYCGGPEHVYFCLKNPLYLRNPKAFLKSSQANTKKKTSAALAASKVSSAALEKKED